MELFSSRRLEESLVCIWGGVEDNGSGLVVKQSEINFNSISRGRSMRMTLNGLVFVAVFSWGAFAFAQGLDDGTVNVGPRAS